MNRRERNNENSRRWYVNEVVCMMVDKAKIAIMRAVGYSQTEIAKELKVSQASVSYALQSLKKKAKEEGNLGTLSDCLFEMGYIMVNRLV